MKYRLVIFILIFSYCQIAFAQKEENTVANNDSAVEYYSGLSDLLALRLYFLVKLNTISISKDNVTYKLNPNSPLGIGAGFNFKGIGLALGIGLPHSSKNISKYGNTSRFDMQMSLYSKLIGGDAYFQYYKGYYNSNPNDFVEWDQDHFPKIPDMQTISLGLNAYYVFNHKRFSNKAAYSRTQIQLKSAGSVALGYFLNYDEVDSPKGFLPTEFPDTIAGDFDINSFRYFATGISVGYMYNWVISKKFFLNISLIPGFGYKDIKLTDGEGESSVEKHPHAQLLIKGALGYENKYFYIGLTGSSLIRNIEYKDYSIDLATEQFRLSIGKRFRIKK